MRSTLPFKLIFVFLALITCGTVSAQTAIPVTNGEGKTVNVDLSGLKRVTIKEMDHEVLHEYSGVLLSDFLAKGGIVLGLEQRKANSSKYIIIRARDNYNTIFTIPEIDPIFTKNTVLLADQFDGKPMSAEKGPYQVIATGDKVHARWINMIVSIEVATVK